MCPTKVADAWMEQLIADFGTDHVWQVGKTVILLHPPLPLVGVSIGMERERQ